jgi:hypothetical protein
MSNFDAQRARIMQVFAADKIPHVTETTLTVYCAYLAHNLACPCLLTGIESLGFFSWEERFMFGRGTKAEHERLRRENGSFRDQYELPVFDGRYDEAWRDLVVNVRRVPGRKRFTIPLSELQAADKASLNHQLLYDYSVWFVNWQ